MDKLKNKYDFTIINNNFGKIIKIDRNHNAVKLIFLMETWKIY